VKSIAIPIGRVSLSSSPRGSDASDPSGKYQYNHSFDSSHVITCTLIELAFAQITRFFDLGPQFLIVSM